jgi:hypothetical protein
MYPITFFGFTFFLATVREAWVLTAFEMNAGEPAYLYAVSNSFDPVNKTLPTIYDTLPPLDHSTITQYRWVWW